MLKKRIIPCLDIKNGRTVKGVNFKGLVDAGNPVELASRYAAEGADELVFLDITATVDKRKTLKNLVSRISEEINIPFTVGGGISTEQDVYELLKAGADKVSVNSAAVRNPKLLENIANRFGNQCLVLAIDANIDNNEWMVYINGGRTLTDKKAVEWAVEAENLGVGEILLTSMRKDGTKSGFDSELNKIISRQVNLPVIASGGAGSISDFISLFKNDNVDAALAASVFHFREIDIPELKTFCKNEKIPMR